MVFYGTGKSAANAIENRLEKKCQLIERERKMLQQKVSKIEYLIGEARNLYYVVFNCNHMIDKLEGEPELQESYIEETLPLIQEHNQILEELLKEFEDYFVLEKVEGAPINFRYRRLYTEMKKDTNPLPL